MNTGLDQYMDIFKDAVEDSAAKLTKSFEKILINLGGYKPTHLGMLESPYVR